MQMTAKELSQEEIKFLQKTISSTSLFWLIIDDLKRNHGSSFLRFADGEYRIIEDSKQYSGKFRAFGDEWNANYGCLDRDVKDLAKELIDSGNRCKYLAPSISGIWWNIYKGWHFFNDREFYAYNFFPYQISDEELNLIFNTTNGICYVHRESKWSESAKSKNLNQSIDWAPLNSYQDIPAVIEKIKNSPHQLILFSGGPIGKILGPELEQYNKVVIDVGSAMWRWA